MTSAGNGAEPETNSRIPFPNRACDFGGSVQQPHVHRRHPKEERRLKISELVENRLLSKAIQQPYTEAGGQPGVQTVGETVDVEQRQRQEHSVAWRQAPASVEH